MCGERGRGGEETDLLPLTCNIKVTLDSKGIYASQFEVTSHLQGRQLALCALLELIPVTRVLLKQRSIVVSRPSEGVDFLLF